MLRPPDGLATIEGSKFESYHVQKSKSLQHHQVTRKIPNIIPKWECKMTCRENPGILEIRILPARENGRGTIGGRCQNRNDELTTGLDGRGQFVHFGPSCDRPGTH